MSRVVQLLSQAARLHAAGDLAGAERLLSQVAQTDPRQAGVQHQLGLVLLEQRRPAEALVPLSRTIALRPDNAAAHVDRGRALAALGRHVEAEAAFRVAISIDPRAARAWAQLGRMYLAQRRDTAAIPPLTRALELNPRDAEAQLAMAHATNGSRCPTAALPHFRRAAELARTPQTLAALGECLIRLSKPEEAFAAFEQALRLDPASTNLHLSRARALEALGRRDDALEVLAKLSADPDANPATIAQYAISARNTEHAQLARGRLLDAITRLSTNSPGMIGLQFALAGFLDDEGDYAGAFRAYHRANSLLPQTFDAAQLEARFDDIIASFPSDRFASFPRSTRPDRTPVFIVGMPRSGTTLLERILGGHPQAAGVGEQPTMIMLAISLSARIGTTTTPSRAVALSTPGALDTLADEYLDSIRVLAPDARRVVDKMPHNFMHLGLISLALPGASIIHNRRHPLDTCLSIYATWLRESHDYAVSLRGIACMYRNYHRLMKHWSTLLGDRIIDCAYEDIVADTAGNARRIIDQIGLPWDDQCLAFHARDGIVNTASVRQVRKPIYSTSTNRWKNYEPYIGELIDSLRDLL
ncbi:MAG: sulfotransferase [Phycisphaerales bacterium]